MKKAIIIAVILILAGGGYYLFAHNKAQAPTNEANEYQSGQTNNLEQPSSGNTAPAGQTPIISNPGGPDYTPSTSPTGGEVPPPNIQVVAVEFDGAKFSPNVVNIKVNDWVFFKNNSTVDFWPASGPHPTHTIYPEFDAKQRIAPGGQFKFQFTKVGSWAYHDHLHPSIGGTVNVAN